MHDAPMHIRMKGLGEDAKLCRRSGELPVPLASGAAGRLAARSGAASAWALATLLCLLIALPPPSRAAAAAATRGPSSRLARLELMRGAALLRRQMARLPEGSAVVLERQPDRLVLRVPAALLFAPDAVSLRSDHDTTAVVSVIAQPLKRRPRLDARVRVYTDSIGGSAFNDSASAARAQAVAAALAAQGVPSSRFEARGAGAAEPVAANDTPAGRIRNRRVEIEFEYAKTLRPARAAGHAGG